MAQQREVNTFTANAVFLNCIELLFLLHWPRPEDRFGRQRAVAGLLQKPCFFSLALARGFGWGTAPITPSSPGAGMSTDLLGRWSLLSTLATVVTLVLVSVPGDSSSDTLLLQSPIPGLLRGSPIACLETKIEWINQFRSFRKIIWKDLSFVQYCRGGTVVTAGFKPKSQRLKNARAGLGTWPDHFWAQNILGRGADYNVVVDVRMNIALVSSCISSMLGLSSTQSRGNCSNIAITFIKVVSLMWKVIFMNKICTNVGRHRASVLNSQGQVQQINIRIALPKQKTDLLGIAQLPLPPPLCTQFGQGVSPIWAMPKRKCVSFCEGFHYAT